MAAPCSSLLLLGAYYYTWYGVGEQWQVFPRPFEPTMGEYRSADASVMRQHHAWARHACIDFFAVSWQAHSQKYSPVLSLYSACTRPLTFLNL
jgi:hypothetical protein